MARPKTKGLKRYRMAGFKSLLLLFAAFYLFNFSALNQSFAQAPFYQGKTIRFIVGYLPGDMHDLDADAGPLSTA